jgi:hypothetical protein
MDSVLEATLWLPVWLIRQIYMTRDANIAPFQSEKTDKLAA